MPASDFVTLRGGLTLPIAAVMLALDLEARGFRIAQDGSDLLVGPAERLTPDDCAQLRRWKHHVLALVSYEAPPCA